MELVHLHDNGDVTIPVVLRKAAALRVINGLAKYARLRGGRMCVLGAIHKVVTGNANNVNLDASLLVKKTAEVLSLKPAAHYGDRPTNTASWALADWNNAPERTAEDVINGLRTAANLIEAQDLAKG